MNVIQMCTTNVELHFLNLHQKICFLFFFFFPLQPEVQINTAKLKHTLYSYFNFKTKHPEGLPSLPPFSTRLTTSRVSNVQHLECIIICSSGLLHCPAINRLSAPLLLRLQSREKSGSKVLWSTPPQLSPIGHSSCRPSPLKSKTSARKYI